MSARRSGFRSPKRPYIRRCYGKIVGFALWFLFFGTFSGRYGLWVANIYVDESYRGIGIGLALFRHMARIAVEKDCSVIQWDVNE